MPCRNHSNGLLPHSRTLACTLACRVLIDGACVKLSCRCCLLCAGTPVRHLQTTPNPQACARHTELSTPSKVARTTHMHGVLMKAETTRRLQARIALPPSLVLGKGKAQRLRQPQSPGPAWCLRQDLGTAGQAADLTQPQHRQRHCKGLCSGARVGLRTGRGRAVRVTVMVTVARRLVREVPVVRMKVRMGSSPPRCTRVACSVGCKGRLRGCGPLARPPSPSHPLFCKPWPSPVRSRKTHRCALFSFATKE